MDDAIDRKGDGEVAPEDEALPVVARMVIEIRSDGARTVARGALEDVGRGERVGIDVRGGSPVELAGMLLRALVAAPVRSVLARMTGPKGHVLEDSDERTGTGRARDPSGLVERVRRRATRAVRRRLGLPTE